MLALCAADVKLYPASSGLGIKPFAIVPYESIERFKRMRNSESGVQVQIAWQLFCAWPFSAETCHPIDCSDVSTNNSASPLRWVTVLIVL